MSKLILSIVVGIVIMLGMEDWQQKNLSVEQVFNSVLATGVNLVPRKL